MRIRITSTVLLLVLAGSAFAGIPMHFGETECTMGQPMEGMDCCKAALMGGESPEAAAASLCCAVNCSHEGSTPPSGVRVSPPSLPLVLVYQGGTPAPAAFVLLTPDPRHSHGPPADLPPAYIRHLALLI